MFFCYPKCQHSFARFPFLAALATLKIAQRTWAPQAALKIVQRTWAPQAALKIAQRTWAPQAAPRIAQRTWAPQAALKIAKRASAPGGQPSAPWLSAVSAWRSAVSALAVSRQRLRRLGRRPPATLPPPGGPPGPGPPLAASSDSWRRWLPEVTNGAAGCLKSQPSPRDVRGAGVARSAHKTFQIRGATFQRHCGVNGAPAMLIQYTIVSPAD